MYLNLDVKEEMEEMINTTSSILNTAITAMDTHNLRNHSSLLEEKSMEGEGLSGIISFEKNASSGDLDLLIMRGDVRVIQNIPLGSFAIKLQYEKSKSTLNRVILNFSHINVGQFKFSVGLGLKNVESKWVSQNLPALATLFKYGSCIESEFASGTSKLALDMNAPHSFENVKSRSSSKLTVKNLFVYDCEMESVLLDFIKNPAMATHLNSVNECKVLQPTQIQFLKKTFSSITNGELDLFLSLVGPKIQLMHQNPHGKRTVFDFNLQKDLTLVLGPEFSKHLNKIAVDIAINLDPASEKWIFFEKFTRGSRVYPKHGFNSLIADKQRKATKADKSKFSELVFNGKFISRLLIICPSYGSNFFLIL